MLLCVYVRGCNNHSFAKLCGFKVNYLQYLSQGLGDDFLQFETDDRFPKNEITMRKK